MVANPKSAGSIEFLSSASSAFAITKHDSTNFATNVRSIYVGGTGDVAVVFPDDTVVTFSAVPAGTTLPVRAKRVNSTNTTATLMVGLL